MKTLTVTEAARGFADLINRVFYKQESALLMRGGKPVAKIVPIERKANTGAELAQLWKTRTLMPLEEAEAFAQDVEQARKSLPPLKDKWE